MSDEWALFGGCGRAKTDDETRIEKLEAQLRLRDTKVIELEEMVDRAHGALNELLQFHINICEPARNIAIRGLFAD